MTIRQHRGTVAFHERRVTRITRQIPRGSTLKKKKEKPIQESRRPIFQGFLTYRSIPRYNFLEIGTILIIFRIFFPRSIIITIVFIGWGSKFNLI